MSTVRWFPRTIMSTVRWFPRTVVPSTGAAS